MNRLNSLNQQTFNFFHIVCHKIVIILLFLSVGSFADSMYSSTCPIHGKKTQFSDEIGNADVHINNMLTYGNAYHEIKYGKKVESFSTAGNILDAVIAGGDIGIGIAEGGGVGTLSGWEEGTRRAYSNTGKVVGSFGGAKVGVTIGATMGSFAGPLGTLVGGVVGGIIGGVIGGKGGETLGKKFGETVLPPRCTCGDSRKSYDNFIDGDNVINNGTFSDGETVENGDSVYQSSDAAYQILLNGGSDNQMVENGDLVCQPSDDNNYITEEGNNENPDDVGNIVAGWSGIGEVFDTALDEMAIVGPTIPHKRVLWLFSGESIWDLFKSAGESLAKNISIDELRKKFSGKWDGVTGNAEYKNQESAFESLKGKLQ